MRVHLLAPPHVQTTAAYALDGFAQRTIAFARLLRELGHDVILYASEENDAPCTTHVQAVTQAEQQAHLGGTAYQDFTPDPSHPLCLLFNDRAAGHLRTLKQAGDVIATICGSAQQLVAETHPELPFLEYSIGYQGIAAGSFRIYQSHAWRHVAHGFTNVRSGRLFDAVIPPWFDEATFPVVEQPEPYVLYCGRLVASKGLAFVCAAAQQAGAPLVVMGHGDPSLVTYGDYLGAVSTAERNRYLAFASAVLMPTQYLEPFGNVTAEAQLCGTPVISSDFGAFTETVEPGVSGFRCVTVGDYTEGIFRASSLDRAAIRARAVRLWGLEAGRRAYRQYFDRFAHREAGWACPLATLPREAAYA